MSPIAAVSVTSTISRSGSTPVADELALDVSEHAAVCDRQSGEVDGHPRVALGKLTAHQGDHLADHHAVDLLDQAVALSRGKEAARWCERPVGIVRESDQRLVVGDGSPLQRDDRLVVEHEQVLAQRVAQAPQPWPWVQSRREEKLADRPWIAPAPVYRIPRARMSRARTTKLELASVVEVGIAADIRRYVTPNAARGARLCGGFRPESRNEPAQNCSNRQSVPIYTALSGRNSLLRVHLCAAPPA